MGISVDYVCKTWTKQMKQFKRPKMEALMPYDTHADFPDRIEYYSLSCEAMIYSSMDEEFCESHYDERYFDIHKEASQRFFDEVKKLQDSPLKQWILSHDGKFIAFNYEKGFWVANELEVIEREVYAPCDFISVREDGKLLMSALSNLRYLYNIDLGAAFITRDYVDCYLPEVKKNLEEQLKNDIVSIALEVEEELSTLVAKEDDEFFIDRMKRIYKIVDAMKQGGWLVYSV